MLFGFNLLRPHPLGSLIGASSARSYLLPDLTPNDARALSSVPSNARSNTTALRGAASQCAIRDKATYANVVNEAGNSNLILGVTLSPASASHDTSISKARSVKHRPS